MSYSERQFLCLKPSKRCCNVVAMFKVQRIYILNPIQYINKGICFSRPSPLPPALTLAQIFIYQPRPWPPISGYRPWPLLCLSALTPNLYSRPWSPNFCLPALVSPEPGFAYTKIVPPICIYWPGLRFLLPCSEFEFIFLSIVVAVAVVILAIAVISQDQIIPSMPILVNQGKQT